MGLEGLILDPEIVSSLVVIIIMMVCVKLGFKRSSWKPIMIGIVYEADTFL